MTVRVRRLLFPTARLENLNGFLTLQYRIFLLRMGFSRPLFLSFFFPRDGCFDNCYNYVQIPTFFAELSLWQKRRAFYNLNETGVIALKKVCYTVILQSQLGPRGGELLLQADSQTVSGELCLLGRRNRFSGSVLQSGALRRHFYRAAGSSGRGTGYKTWLLGPDRLRGSRGAVRRGFRVLTRLHRRGPSASPPCP